MLKYTDKHIAENMKEHHVKMCHQYRTTRMLAEVEDLNHGLRPIGWIYDRGKFI